MTVTIDGLTKTRMLEIEAASVVGGAVNGAGHLILTRHDGAPIDAGYVIGPQGPPYVNGVDTVSNQNIGGLKTFTQTVRGNSDIFAQNGTGNQVRIGVVAAGAGAGIEFGGPQHSIAIIAANRLAFTLNNVEMIDLQPSIISFLQPVAAATVTNKFGRGVTGAANAFVQIGDDNFGGLIQAGHGTVADIDLRIQAKGIGNAVFLSPVLSLAAANSFGRGSQGSGSAFVIIGDDVTGAMIKAGHGTVANMDLQLYAKGTGKTIVRNGSGVVIAQFETDGTSKMIGPHQIFGPGADGATGKRLHIAYDATFSYVIGEDQAGSSSNGNIYMQGGSIYMQMRNSSGEIRIFDLGGLYLGGVDIGGQTKWKGQWHGFGQAALGGPGRYIQIGEDGSGSAVVSSQGSPTDIHMAIRSKGTGTIFFQRGDGSTTYMQLSNASADLDTWMLIRRSVGGVERVDRVSVSGVDSGGAGFRLLRVPN